MALPVALADPLRDRPEAAAPDLAPVHHDDGEDAAGGAFFAAAAASGNGAVPCNTSEVSISGGSSSTVNDVARNESRRRCTTGDTTDVCNNFRGSATIMPTVICLERHT
jgi:hypothetical protein